MVLDPVVRTLTRMAWGAVCLSHGDVRVPVPRATRGEHVGTLRCHFWALRSTQTGPDKACRRRTKNHCHPLSLRAGGGGPHCCPTPTESGWPRPTLPLRVEARGPHWEWPTLQTAGTLPLWVWASRLHLSGQCWPQKSTRCTGTLSVDLRTSLEWTVRASGPPLSGQWKQCTALMHEMTSKSSIKLHKSHDIAQRS